MPRTKKSKKTNSIETNHEEAKALSEADELYSDGLDLGTAEGAVDGALAALEISPLLADAYVTMAMYQSRGAAEELFYWRSGLLAAELTLGADLIDELRGEFWVHLETRPYMRAKHGLALALWSVEQETEAIMHLEDMLSLNPNDNQGARWVLMNFLLQRQEHKKAAALLGKYPGDISADMKWGAVLLAFQQKEAEAASTTLVEALECNPHVPAYLLSTKKLPKRMPEYYEMGSKAEAMLYFENCGSAWQATRGALQWLQSATQA